MVRMNIKDLGKIITKMIWGKTVMTFVGNIEMIYVIKLRTLKIKK